MPGKRMDHPSERNQDADVAGHHPDDVAQKIDRRQAGGERGSTESAKHGTGETTRRSVSEVEEKEAKLRGRTRRAR